MASGFAAQVARLYPEVRKAYIDKYLYDGWKVGDVQVIEVASDPLKMIANIAGQEFYGREPGRAYIDYDGLRAGLSRLLDYAEGLGFSVSCPRMGCGLAGGNWKIIQQLMRDCIKNRTINLEVSTPV